MTRDPADALSLSVVKDKLKDIELACPGSYEGHVDDFLNNVQRLAEEYFSRAESNRTAVLEVLEKVRNKVGSFAGDAEQFRQYLVRTAAIPYYFDSLCFLL